MKKMKFKSSAKSQGPIYIFIAISVILVSLFLTSYQMSNQQIQKKILELDKGLHVQGNKLVNGQGEQILFHGVDRSGTEYQCVQNGEIFERTERSVFYSSNENVEDQCGQNSS